MSGAPGPGRRSERGSTSLSVVLLTPAMLAVLGLAVFAGRLAGAEQDVVSAAHDAARAASMRQYPDAAAADAQAAASRTLETRGVSCAALSVQIDTSAFRPDGSVAVTVSCTIDNSDLLGIGMPGTRTVDASATAVIDRYRGGEP